jgi:hypothetical protein
MWFYDLIAERAQAENKKKLGGDPVQACVQASQIHVQLQKEGVPTSLRENPSCSSKPLILSVHTDGCCCLPDMVSNFDFGQTVLTPSSG